MSNIETLLAKSDGIELISHSKEVCDKSLEILKLFNTSIYDKYYDIIEKSSLIHDIGKSINSFQEVLRGKKGKKNNKYLHNEIGWAFITHYLNHKYVELIANNVYWHHGIYNKMSSYTSLDVLKTLKDDDIDKMKEFLKYIIGKEDCIKEFSENDDTKAPLYYVNKDKIIDIHNENVTNLILRTCLISADRIVSSNRKDIIELVNKTNKIGIEDLDLKSYNKERIDKQLEILDSVNNTTIIKAPAGFGKTLLGLFWNIKCSKKKLIWVCPRNTIALSVYESIITELALMNVNISVELFLTGEIQKSNNESNGFESDIIITNIDNYLRPSIDNKVSDKLFFINDVDVIFDEYHELITDEAMFSCFRNIMYIRNNFTNSKTLLLSATPTIMNFIWENNNNKTLLLPNEDEHYIPIHDKKYKIDVLEFGSFDELAKKIKPNNSSLIISNSISNSQLLTYLLDNKHLIHSDFEENKKKQIFSDLMNKYSKKSERLENKENVISTHILQASLDISFHNLFESCMSPESTLQRLGRNDRWGDYINESCFTSFRIKNDLSEQKTIDVLYNKELNSLWFDELREISGHLSIKEFYILYNKFNKKYRNEIKDYINSKLFVSAKNLSYIYPKKYSDRDGDGDDIIVSGGNKLRVSTKTCFIVVKKYNSNILSDIFSVNVRNDYEEFDGDDIVNAEKRLNKFIKYNKDKRYDYTSLITREKHIPIKKIREKSIPIKKIREKSNLSISPYYIDSKVYHEELYGLIKCNLLNSFK